MAHSLNPSLQHSSAKAMKAAGVFFHAGDFAAAREVLMGIKPDQPGYEQACQMVARTWLAEGRDDRFLGVCQSLIEQFPHTAQNHQLLGVAFSRTCQWDEAIAAFRAALAINPGDMAATENLGIALDIHGWHHQSWATLGPVLQRQGKLGRAGFLAYIRNALLLNQRRAAFDAVRLIQRAIPADPAIMHLDARVAFAHSDNPGGKKLLDQLRKKHPRNPDVLTDLGIYALSSGDQRNAEKLLRKAIKADPFHAAAHYTLADMGGGGRASDADRDCEKDRSRRLKDIASAMDDPATPYIKKAQLGFAAGKIFESRGRHDEAFACYDRANRRIWARLPDNAGDFQPEFDTARSVFDATFFASHAQKEARKESESRAAGRGMVFLVGMPRSGTTLLEQILSGLPGVVAGGESGEIATLGQQLATADGCDNRLASMTAHEIAELSTRQMADFDKTLDKPMPSATPPPRNSGSGQGRWRTNKEMQLFLRLGIIATLFPAAKIIHIRRNAVDTCVSAYFQFFKLYHQQASFNLRVLGHYYRACVEIMDHWAACLPLDIHQVSYEDLTREPDTVVKGIADHCGMQWSDDCLDFRHSDHLVTTASIWQVRQGLNRNSVERWRRYEKHLGPLLDGLGDVCDL